MARSSSYVLLLLLWAADIDAGPLRSPLTRRNDKTSIQNATAGWSKEAIFTLVGVCVAGLSVLIGLVSSPKLRKWLCKPIKYFSKARRVERSRQRIDERRRLQEEYNEYLRFNDFLELRGGRPSSSQPW